MADQENHEVTESKSPVARRDERSVIQLGDVQILQTAGLSDTQIQELKVAYARGLIDVNRKAQELKVDVGALDAALRSMADQTRRVSEAGDSITISHAQTTALGRTEVMIGNTDRAARGKLSRSQAGEKDNTLIYLIVGAVVILVVAAILAS